MYCPCLKFHSILRWVRWYLIYRSHIKWRSMKGIVSISLCLIYTVAEGWAYVPYRSGTQLNRQHTLYRALFYMKHVNPLSQRNLLFSFKKFVNSFFNCSLVANVNNNLNNNQNNANKNNINTLNQDSNNVASNTNAVNQLMVGKDILTTRFYIVYNNLNPPLFAYGMRMPMHLLKKNFTKKWIQISIKIFLTNEILLWHFLSTKFVKLFLVN